MRHARRHPRIAHQPGQHCPAPPETTPRRAPSTRSTPATASAGSPCPDNHTRRDQSEKSGSEQQRTTMQPRCYAISIERRSKARPDMPLVVTKVRRTMHRLRSCPCEGPWRDNQSREEPDEELPEMEDGAARSGGARLQLQTQARIQLRAARLPVTRRGDASCLQTADSGPRRLWSSLRMMLGTALDAPAIRPKDRCARRYDGAAARRS